MNHQSTFNIVCSFLGPVELVKTRRLDHLRKKWIDVYLKTLKLDTLNIEEKVCPICGGWISEDDISSYTGFYDLMYYEESTRIGYLETTFEGCSYKRTSLLCDMCEYNEDYNDYNEWEIENLQFRYRGSRVYSLFIVNDYILPWTFIYRKIDKKILWNQYQKVNDPIEYREEDEDMEEIEYIW